jgi:murein DD-endopeptidase / murein LD-carboxypeptidase
MIRIAICIALICSLLFSNCAIKKNTNKHVATTDKTKSDLLQYAKTYIGTNYKYGGTLPNTGFDCSGYVQYVFTHFGFKVPRVSKDYANIGTAIQIADAKPEDIILFAGSDGNLKTVQHMGIVIETTKNNIQFIHSSSSKGVMISNLNSYFKPRLIKIIRLQK